MGSGWNYDDWRGRLYPEGLGKLRWLGRYAELFDTVEVNSTSTGSPLATPSRAGWRRHPPASSSPPRRAATSRTSGACATCGRGSSAITSAYSRCLRRTSSARSSGSYRRTSGATTRSWGRCWRSCPEGRHCFEFRHESWFVPPVYELLGSSGAALVIADHPRWPFQAHGESRRTGRSSGSTTAGAAGAATTRRPSRRVGPAAFSLAPPGRGLRLLQQRLGGLRGLERALAQAAAAAVSRRVSARLKSRDTCICE